MRYGTCYFVDLNAAERYYAQQGETAEDVATKIAEGEIQIGKLPAIKPNEFLYADKDEGRYFVCDTAEDVPPQGYGTRRNETAIFAGRIKGMGFRVFMAKSGTYGFITDETGSRVLSFSFSDWPGNLGGNYASASTKHGTGWRMERGPYELKTAEDVKSALYANAPEWTAGGGKNGYATAEQHLKVYGSSSGYVEV